MVFARTIQFNINFLLVFFFLCVFIDVDQGSHQNAEIIRTES